MTPSIIAHRGASGREFENSRAAFARAVELGADGVELDVHSSSDGIILVHHDAELEGLGPIGHLSYMAMQEFRLPNGETVPTLPEVLEILGDLDVYVEVKSLSPAFDPSLLSVLDQGPAPARYAVHSFDHRI
ncbi:MAG: glycerophosphodiester phosphodiesterase, partial [Gemmatimonadota bacterium]